MVGLALVWCAATVAGLVGGWPAGLDRLLGVVGSCVPGGWLAAGLATLGLVALAVLRRRRARRTGAPARPAIPVGLWLLVLITAWFNAALWQRHSLARAFPAGSSSCRLTVWLTVADDPILRPFGSNRVARVFPARLRGAGLATNAAPTSRLCGDLLVRWYGSPRAVPAPRAGQHWQMTGRLETSTRTDRAPRHILTVNREDTRPVGLPAYGWWQRLFLTRRNAADLLGLGIEAHPRETTILRAIMLGHRSQLDPALFDAFAATGTVHIFAISGLNIGMIAGFIVFALRAARLSREYWILPLAPLLVGFTVMTGARASAVRACVMAVVYFAAPLLRRRADGLSALGLAAVLILAAAPNQWRDIGFQLSFMAMLGLVTVAGPIERLLRRGWAPDPWRIQTEAWPVRLARALGRQVAGLLAMSAAAWLVTAPLTALYFGRFTPVALLANLWTVPVAFLIVLTGSLSLVGGMLAGWLAVVFNHANVALIALLTGSMRLAARLPGGTFAFPAEAVPGWAAAAAYLPIGLLVWWLRRRAFSAGVEALDDDPMERAPPR